MTEPPTTRKIVQFRLRPGSVEARVKDLAVDTGNIDWSFHAQERMEVREIYDADVLRVLRNGHIEGSPETVGPGEVKCKMVKPIRGNREIGVVTIIVRDSRLFIMTVEWEDLRS
jgi:hypothetical protein